MSKLYNVRKDWNMAVARLFSPLMHIGALGKDVLHTQWQACTQVSKLIICCQRKSLMWYTRNAFLFAFVFPFVILFGKFFCQTLLQQISGNITIQFSFFWLGKEPLKTHHRWQKKVLSLWLLCEQETLRLSSFGRLDIASNSCNCIAVSDIIKNISPS